MWCQLSCVHLEMVMMFSRDQAALLSVQLMFMCRVFAEPPAVQHRNKVVSSGDSIKFTCNTNITEMAEKDVTHIKWTKDTFLFSQDILNNQTFSNFTYDKVKIDTRFPFNLIIFNAQYYHAGLFTCRLTRTNGPSTAVWNLTVSEKSEKSEEINSKVWYFVYILPVVSGLLLCGITSAVCISRRKRKSSALNQDPDPDQIQTQSGLDVVQHQLQADAESMRSNTRRTCYVERLNSIYGLS
ncbi:uncharacterized protein LOC115062173 [Echeneis naucrates]|uniref:uncharacterized protein LOC115062173 n=1 Tax=Echeneis naucrates TaxID=173247 RepID=UPI0011144175|nr:uncharacterized protein LOC115062173 [Echeneis naucrates]